MKKLLLTLISIACFINSLQADLGSCIVYQAKFYLKDGSTFNGCFEYSGYEKEAYFDRETESRNEYCNDEGVFTLFKKLQKRMGESYQRRFPEGPSVSYVEVYKNLEAIPLRSVGGQNRSTFKGYGFTAQKDIIMLDTSDIEKMVFWDATYTKREWLTSRIHISTKSMFKFLLPENQCFKNLTSD